MIPKPEIAKQTVVFQHVGAKLLDFGLVFEMEVAFKEAFVQFDDLTQRQMLPRGLVQPTSSLDELRAEEWSVSLAKSLMREKAYHESVVVWCADGDRLETVVDEIE